MRYVGFRDDRGAILVIGVFMAVVMAALLFYVAGVGEAILERERLQDLADGAAFRVAVIHARGMNVVALVNQVMAALLAILVALRLVEMLATFAIAALAALAFVPGAQGAAAAIPPLQEVRSAARQSYDALDRPVHDALKALHEAELAVRSAVPALSAADGVAASSGSPRGPVSFAVPPRTTLPLENDAFDVLCEHAAKDAAGLAMLPVKPFLPGVSGEVEDLLGDLAGDATDWFCGKGGKKRPSAGRDVKEVLPILAVRARCDELGRGSDPVATARACADVERVEEQAKPDSLGRCATECGAKGPYEERVRLARAQCDPRSGRSLRGFQWQERTVRMEWNPRAGAFERVHESEPVLVTEPEGSAVHPCGDGSALYSPDYDARVHAAPGDSAVLPVCTSPSPPAAFATTSFEVTEVLHVLRCIGTKHVKLEGKAASAGGGEDEAPLRVEANVEPGSEGFRIRGGAVTPPNAAWVEQLVGMAAWGAPGAEPPAALVAMERAAVAEAEYGYDGAGARGEWMWRRRWAARLARVRKAPEAVDGALVAGCTARAPKEALSACAGVAAAFGPLADVVSH